MPMLLPRCARQADKAALDWVKQLVDPSASRTRQAGVNAVTGKLPAEYMRDACLPRRSRRRQVDVVRYDRAGKETRR